MSDQGLSGDAIAQLVPAQRAYDTALDELRAFEIARPTPPRTWPTGDRHRHDDLAAAVTSALLHLHVLRATHGATSWDAVQRIQRLARDSP